MTQGENIADNGGLKVAYRAYKHWAVQNGNEHRLPALNYSVTQLFWISFAQLWCSVSSDEHINMTIARDVHPPDRYRVIVPLSNLEMFSRDFNCPRGSPMNPDQKCEVW